MDKAVDFSFLDQESFRTKYVQRNSVIRFFIGGMKCSRCVRKLEGLSGQLDGVRSVRVDMGRAQLEAEIDPTHISFSRFAAEIARLGFDPIPLAQESLGEDLRRREDRQELIRLGVAAACAGNIMTFSFATYLGDTAEFFQLFAWLSFVLYIPVVSYVAVPFYRGAWASLRQRRVSVDLPMAVASFLGFVFSTVELLRGRSDIYFDSLSGFLFLILASRWAQRRLQTRFIRPQGWTESLHLGRVRKMTGDSWEWTLLENLQLGDRILIKAGETAPADGVLSSPFAHFSLAWLSGESKAQTFLRDSSIPAGARLTAGEVALTVKAKLPDTEFGRIMNVVERVDLSDAHTVNLTDRWSQYLLGTVFAVAVIFLALYWTVSPEEAIRRALALIILACPCAMAFGTPLAFASALSRARRKGLFVRRARAFENAARAETLFFDKTGTLTECDLTLLNPERVPAEIRSLVLALENTSLHPIAFAFRSAFVPSGELPSVRDAREEPGSGVEGVIEGVKYEIRRAPQSTGGLSCALYKNAEALYVFEFGARLQPDAQQVLRQLREDGYQLRLVSGDGRAAAHTLGTRLGFAADEIYAGMSPQQKADLVAGSPNSIMIGDGVNDSLAMIQAGVGVAAAGGVEAALRSSDVYMSGSSIQGVRDLLQISKESLALVRQNLAISLIYNLTAGVLALLGVVNPFVAALLMPVSSGFILLSTWIRGRQ